MLLELFTTNLIEKRIIAILLSNIVVFGITYWFYIKQIKYKSYNITNYKLALSYLFGFGLPLILHNVSLFLKGQLDRIFIFHQFSQYELGLYAMGAQIAAMLMIALQAINKALIPYFFEGLKQNRINLKNIHNWTFISFLIVPLPALLFSLIPESMIIWLLGDQFLNTKYYILCFLFSTALVIPYFILVNYLFYYGKNKLISLCSVISTVIYIIGLIGLSQTQVEYIPFASIIGGIMILPILFFMTKQIKVKQ